MGIPGVVFDEAWPRRMEVDFAGLLVSFICREDLIAAKRASGRPQDLLDVMQLTQSEGKSTKRRSPQPTRRKVE